MVDSTNNHRRALHLLIAVHGTAAVLANLPVLTAQDTITLPTLDEVRAGLNIGQVFLVACYGVLGTGSTNRRLTISTLTAAGLTALPIAVNYWVGRVQVGEIPLSAQFLAFTIFWLGSTGMAGIAYRCRGYRIRHGSESVTVDRAPANQFTIRHLLVLTTIAAVVALLTRQLALSVERAVVLLIIGHIVLTIAFGLWMLPMLSLVLRPTCPQVVRSIIVLWSTALPLSCVVWVTRSTSFPSALRIIVIPLVALFITYYGTLLCLRWLGWELSKGCVAGESAVGMR